MKKTNVQFASLKLPSLFGDLEYFSPMYRKNIREITGIYELGWQQLKLAAPTAEITWHASKTTFFKVLIQTDTAQNLCSSRIIGFDQHKLTTSRPLKIPHVRHILYIQTRDEQRLQLQLIYLYANLSVNETKKMKRHVETILKNIEFRDSTHFFELFLGGYERDLTTLVKTEFKNIKGVQFVKCKVL